MSIVATVKVYDGIVLGADSQTQLLGQPAPNQPLSVIKTYSNAKKLFEIKGKPIGILTYGIGNIGERSIESHIVEFADAISQEKISDVKTIAEKLLSKLSDAFHAVYPAVPKIDPSHSLGIVVAGYSDGNPLAEEWEFVIPQDTQIRVVLPTNVFGANWRGIWLPFARLAQGFDPRIFGILKANGVTDEQIKKIQESAGSLKMNVQFNGMPLQDAIDYCRFIVATTVGTSQFDSGIPACGGPIDIAIITPKEKTVKWISEKVLK
jgi:hypothetical protein